jgi:SHS2 domain-containing protein
MIPPVRVEPEHRFVEHGGEVEVELSAEDEIGIVEDGSLQATVAGYRGTPRPLVKGVALNRLVFEREGGAWHGRLVFDV